MKSLHAKLREQIILANLDISKLDPEIVKLLRNISDKFEHYEHDHNLLVMGLTLSSNETQQLAVNLQRQNKILEESIEKMKQQSIQLASQTRLSSLGEMAGNIAHEINGPLGIILGYADELLENVKGDVVEKDEVEFFAQKIHDNVIRISKIIKGLKSISRNASDDPYVETPLIEIINDSVELCKQRMINRGANLVLGDIPKDVVLECRGTQLSQVVLNLLNNAADAVSELQDRWVKLEVQDNTENILVIVTDSGKGIPEEVQKKMFEAYFTTKKVGHGTGLGLSISRRIVESHNGTFVIDNSFPNTRMVITLPKKQPKTNNGGGEKAEAS